MTAPIFPPDLFDEAGYLRRYPDIREAVAAGREASAWAQYRRQGRAEGRAANDVDPAFYLRTYPLAAADIAAGRAGDAASHYLHYGRGRGYRPNPSAPAAPAAPLWTDLPQALDLLDGRLALGRISEAQAALLRRWIADGYVVLPAAIDRGVVQAAALDLERGFAGACPDLLFSCGAVSLGPLTWQPEINPYPAAALDFHYLSRPIRDLLLAEPVRSFLELVFDGPALLAHSRGMLRDAAQAPQRDIATAAFSLPGQFATAWIGLDTPGQDAAIDCFPASHRLPAIDPHAIAQAERALALPPARIAAEPGHAVIRHPALVHRAAAVPADRTSRGILAQYCPLFVLPRFMEGAARPVWPHERHGFTARLYPRLDPLD